MQHVANVYQVGSTPITRSTITKNNTLCYYFGFSFDNNREALFFVDVTRSNYYSFIFVVVAFHRTSLWLCLYNL